MVYNNQVTGFTDTVANATGPWLPFISTPRLLTRGNPRGHYMTAPRETFFWDPLQQKEDHLLERFNRGVRQFVILGAGLDAFAERAPQSMPGLRIFEVDQPATQEWKQQRLIELGFGVPENLRFVPVDFEKGDSWWEKLMRNGFDAAQPAVVASTGVSLYLTKDANAATLSQVAALNPGSSLVMTFYLPLELIDAAERPLHQMIQERARAAGLPVPGEWAVFLHDFDLMGVQRHLKVLGIFARINYRDGKPHYLKDTPRFIGYVRGVAARYPELTGLLRLFDELGLQA